jgi:plastocyanin
MARRGVTVMLVAAPAMALALALGGCGGGDDGSAGGGGAYGGGQPAATTAAAGGPAAAGGVDVTGKSAVDVVMRDDAFAPAVLRGTPGQAITIDLENTGTQEHNFSLGSQGVDTDVEPGETATVTVAFPEGGTLEFVCEYHEAQGMTGSLEVPAS